MTIIVDHNGVLKTVDKYGLRAYDANNNIVAINGMTLKVEHLPEYKGELEDYFLACVDGVQIDGVTHNEAVENALKALESSQYRK